MHLFVLLAVGVFCSLLILADVVYYRFFGDVLSTPALLAAHQTGHVWGSVGSLFKPARTKMARNAELRQTV